MIYLQKDSIRYFDKYEVRSPILSDHKAEKVNFLDVQRVPLQNGVYQFEMQVKDMNGDGENIAYTHNDVIVLNFK